MTERNHISDVIKGAQCTFGEGTSGSAPRLAPLIIQPLVKEPRGSVHEAGTINYPSFGEETSGSNSEVGCLK